MAGYRLRTGLSFCRIDNRTLFLDLPADRYFGLGGPLDTAFQALLDTGAADPALATLVERGLIIPCPEGGLPVPCPTTSPGPILPPPSEPPARPSLLAIAMALVARVHWTLRVRYCPLAANIDRLARRKDAPALRPRPTSAAIARLAEAHRRAGLILSARDQCLPTSMALMATLTARGANPTLVLGVKLDPFQAHCWVELAGTVLNDAPDHVRPFTPIRRV
ncbi:lasso peptide biosynthesis B2 protein [Sphingobium sp. ba1]|uniref:lasso peptide biosynthesis B2 protein n=1 Tax=Sphingobium sp. ba1 TaxID=1522072 RepID=UPI00068BE659|nr:lasso peptide biosynthesis B2 protein [Sphingobium sp. ba1]